MYYCAKFAADIQPMGVILGELWTLMDQHRYIITSNITRFEAHLRGGLLDPGQTRIVTALLAEAHAALGEFDLRATIKYPPSATDRLPEPAPAA